MGFRDITLMFFGGTKESSISAWNLSRLLLWIFMSTYFFCFVWISERASEREGNGNKKKILILLFTKKPFFVNISQRTYIYHSKNIKSHLHTFFAFMQVFKGHVTLGNARFPCGTMGTTSVLFLRLLMVNSKDEFME